MKKLIPLLSLGLFATILPSCCGFGGCKRLGRIERVGCENQTDECGACGSTYCPAPECCGTISPAVLKRATAQNGTGEPHIGTIPTMKVLAE